MQAVMPRIEINLSKIRDNTRILCQFYNQNGISLMGVTKAVLGHPLIAEVMIQGGIKFIADSRIENIQRMKRAGIAARFVLLRTALSQAESIVRNADISLNTEIETIKALSHHAQIYHKIHQIIVMVELGDLREGILPDQLVQFIKKVLSFSHIEVIGIGCNLACYGGIKPDDDNMGKLSKLAHMLKKEFKINLEIISGGNSANYNWVSSTQKIGKINNLRLGESIFLGRESLRREAILGLYTDAFRLVGEVIESQVKPSLPYGETGQNAFGDIAVFSDRGIRRRIIVALGRQDILVSGLRPRSDLTILGSSSDHLIIDSNNEDLSIGSEVNFDLSYGGLLSAMTSPFIHKQFIHRDLAAFSSVPKITRLIPT